MAKKKVRNDYETTSYSIAHYILMFLLVCICIVIVAWIMIAGRYHTDTDTTGVILAETETVTDTARPVSPCAQQIINNVAQMWTYNPDQVPSYYWDVATKYVNGTVTERIDGVCDKVRYVCDAGQRRRDCNPCAVSTGITIAMDRHASDLIAKKCPKQ